MRRLAGIGSLTLEFHAEDGTPLEVYNYKNAMTLTLPVDGDKAENAVALIYNKSTGELLPRSRSDESGVSARAYGGGTYDVKYAEAPVFTDTAGKWMDEAAQVIYNMLCVDFAG